MGTHELKFKKGVVWINIDRLRVFSEDEKVYIEGDFIAYFSFKPPDILLGELIKDNTGRPYTWPNAKDALNYAKEKFKNLLN